VNLSKGLPDGERLLEGEEDESWLRLVHLGEKEEWKQECLKRDEKFDMYFSAAVRIYRLQRSPLSVHIRKKKRVRNELTSPFKKPLKRSSSLAHTVRKKHTD
jgi:hypothetical protein